MTNRFANVALRANAGVPPAAIPQPLPGAAAQDQTTWNLIWVQERCHKSEHRDRCRLLREHLMEHQGGLKCFKKASKLYSWLAQEPDPLNYVLVTDWREAKPCAEMLLDPAIAMRPVCTVVLCSSQRQMRRVLEWRRTLLPAAFPIVVCDQSRIPHNLIGGLLRNHFGPGGAGADALLAPDHGENRVEVQRPPSASSSLPEPSTPASSDQDQAIALATENSGESVSVSEEGPLDEDSAHSDSGVVSQEGANSSLDRSAESKDDKFSGDSSHSSSGSASNSKFLTSSSGSTSTKNLTSASGSASTKFPCDAHDTSESSSSKASQPRFSSVLSECLLMFGTPSDDLFSLDLGVPVKLLRAVNGELVQINVG